MEAENRKNVLQDYSVLVTQYPTLFRRIERGYQPGTRDLELAFGEISRHDTAVCIKAYTEIIGIFEGLFQSGSPISFYSAFFAAHIISEYQNGKRVLDGKIIDQTFSLLK